jgi:hypothetical protein
VLFAAVQAEFHFYPLGGIAAIRTQGLMPTALIAFKRLHLGIPDHKAHKTPGRETV